MRTGSRSGLRVLAAQEDLARELGASLDWRDFEDDFGTDLSQLQRVQRAAIAWDSPF